MLGERPKGDCAFDIDPPTSSYAIMRRTHPYRGENSEPGKDGRELDGIREQHRSMSDIERINGQASASVRSVG